MNIKRIPSTITVYALRDPETQELRYVGVTSRELRVRLLGHLTDPCVCHRTHWIRSLARRGLMPTIEALETIPFAGWQARETAWIAHLRKLGYRLVNNRAGGEGFVPGHRMSKKSRTKLSASLRKYHQEHPEARKKIGDHHRGKTLTAAQKKAVSKAAKKRWRLWRASGAVTSQATRDKISAARKGKPLSEAHRRSMSKATRGVPKNPEHRMRLAEHCRRLAAVRMQKYNQQKHIIDVHD